MPITDYELLSAHTTSELDSLVSKKLNAGWQPYGNPSYSDLLFIQAVIKKE